MKLLIWRSRQNVTRFLLLPALLLLGSASAGPVTSAAAAEAANPPAGSYRWNPRPAPGTTVRYAHRRGDALPSANVKEFALSWGNVERTPAGELQWMVLSATKAGGGKFQVWLLTDAYPAETLSATRRQVARFILKPGASGPSEFRDRVAGGAVLPSLGGWWHLFPRAVEELRTVSGTSGFPSQTRYLGHVYRLSPNAESESSPDFTPPDARVIGLLPDVLVGVPSNMRQKDSTRRYDDSEYEYVRLGRENYREMAEAGMNCFRVDKDQLPFLEDLDVFYWGLGAKDLVYPECLYDSRYLGPALFLDEPGVVTRDHVLRPRLAKDNAFRTAITPQIAFDEFREYYARAWREGTATSFIRGLAGRSDADAGDMRFPQENLFSWETIVSTAAYQLAQDSLVPAALVFEPPGRVGTLRTLPELNMTYGCQIPADNPNYFIDIIYGFLRGAARLTGKAWGTSIYGSVDRADAYGYLSRAYDLGATRFFFWDNARLACVPYEECLALARHLQRKVENRPHRDLWELRRAAEVAILLPAGYNLGHVHLGKGNLWGVGELNLERVNNSGVKYRTVMGNFFTEIERCLRLGIAFDLLGEFPGTAPLDYREVVRIREDGKVEVTENGRSLVLDQARVPVRPPGAPPRLAVDLPAESGKSPLQMKGTARVTQTTAPVFYTLGTDAKGIYHNAVVAWDLYGPGDADHRFVASPSLRPRVVKTGDTYEVTVEFKLERPGTYRLRAATVDLAGRSSVVWKRVIVTE